MSTFFLLLILFLHFPQIALSISTISFPFCPIFTKPLFFPILSSLFLPPRTSAASRFSLPSFQLTRHLVPVPFCSKNSCFPFSRQDMRYSKPLHVLLRQEQKFPLILPILPVKLGSENLLWIFNGTSSIRKKKGDVRNGKQQSCHRARSSCGSGSV